MTSYMLRLQWKEFFRSPNWQKSLGLKIIMIFLALYFTTAMAVFSLVLPELFEELQPEFSPFTLFNRYAILYFALELLVRLQLQTLPALSIKPFMNLPISKNSLVHFVLRKSIFSFYNLSALVLLLPFSIRMIIDGMDPYRMTVYILSLYILAVCINYLVFLIKRSLFEKIGFWILLLGAIATAFLLEFFDIFPVSFYTGKILEAFYYQPYLLLWPAALLFVLYRANFRFLRERLYLDAAIQSKSDKVSTAEYSWTEQFGDLAPLMQLNIKMIMRNKRPKMVVYMSIFMMLYGLLFYPQETYQDMPGWLVFVGIFMTGVFAMSFGQFVPAWDSAYFNLLMTQNFTMRHYLRSKYMLLMISIPIMMLLTLPYVYFGKQYLWLNLSCGIYNMGINVLIVLFGGSYNYKRIDLNKTAFMNTQGSGASQFLVVLPLLFGPMILFYPVYKFFSFEAGCWTLALIGLIVLSLHGILLKKLEGEYLEKKYKFINGFQKK